MHNKRLLVLNDTLLFYCLRAVLISLILGLFIEPNALSSEDFGNQLPCFVFITRRVAQLLVKLRLVRLAVDGGHVFLFKLTRDLQQISCQVRCDIRYVCALVIS